MFSTFFDYINFSCFPQTKNSFNLFRFLYCTQLIFKYNLFTEIFCYCTCDYFLTIHRLYYENITFIKLYEMLQTKNSLLLPFT